MRKPGFVFVRAAVTLMFLVAVAPAATIDITSSATGTIWVNQSFNETRAVDVAVLASNLLVSSMTLNEFNIGSETGSVGARIYNSDGILYAGADMSVSAGFDQSLTIPISAILAQGETFRIGFFISAPQWGGTGDFLDPDPVGNSVSPYSDPTGWLLITAAYSFPADVFPTYTNRSVPLMTIEAEPYRPVPEPASLALLTVGVGVLAAARKRRSASPSRVRLRAVPSTRLTHGSPGTTKVSPRESWGRFAPGNGGDSPPTRASRLPRSPLRAWTLPWPTC